MNPALLARLDDRDRALFGQWSLATRGSADPADIRAWRIVTHCGGVRASIAAAALPLLISDPASALHAAASTASIGLALSHLLIQLVKRRVGRPRPSSRFGCATLVDEPACFSFPSGHATAAMSVAFAYAVSFPGWAAFALSAAALVGFSRVRLGVHYPGDVLAGQVIALATDLVLRTIR